MIGVDEAGRGSWAGPLVAVAVRLKSDWADRGLGDSKLLTASLREKLVDELKAAGEEFALGLVEAAEIDKHGLSWAQTEAMSRAVSQLKPAPKEEIIVDGSINYLKDIYNNSSAVIKADQKYMVVMAASILAKVWRDQHMIELSRLYPDYGFELHKGYGTEKHRVALIKNGACLIHRHSYRPIKELLTRS